jgi:hypothetical protein
VLTKGVGSITSTVTNVSVVKGKPSIVVSSIKDKHSVVLENPAELSSGSNFVEPIRDITWWTAANTRIKNSIILNNNEKSFQIPNVPGKYFIEATNQCGKTKITYDIP